MTTIHESNLRPVDETIELEAIHLVFDDERDPRSAITSSEPNRFRTRLGWLLAGLAVAASATLAVAALRDPSSPPPITDAKDNPNFGPITQAPVVRRPITDAKDNPNFGPITQVPVGGSPGSWPAVPRTIKRLLPDPGLTDR